MTMRKNRLGLVLSCLLWAGCNSDLTQPATSTQALAVPLEGALLYLMNIEGHSQARIVDVSRNSPRVHEHALPGGMALSRTRPQSGSKQAVVLTKGVEAALIDGKVRESIPSYLVVYDKNGEVLRKELGGRFNELTLSEDGRTAVAHGEEPGVGWGNTVSIVDLVDVDAPARNVTLSDSTGRPPRSFEFARLDDAGSRRLLLVRGYDSVSVLDLDHLDRPSKEVPLTTAEQEWSLQAGKAVFQPDAIFLQLLGSSDVLVLQLIDGEADSFRVTPLTLATESEVRDIEVVGEGAARRVVAVGRGSISVVDPVTAEARTTPTPGADFVDLIPFAGRAPHDDEVSERGLLVARNDARIAFVDFDRGSAWAHQAFEPLSVVSPIVSSIPVLEHGLVVLSYWNGEMGLVDLERRTVTPIRTGTQAEGTLLDSSEDRADLWVNLENARIARIDLLRLETAEVLLNAQAASIVMIEGESRRLAALHQAPSGYITLLDPKKPSRESAREFAAFFFTGLLD